MKPVILTTIRKKPYRIKFMEYTYVCVKPNFDIVEKFGGLPVVASIVKSSEEAERLVASCDGLLVTGGDDVDPASYGEEKKDYCDTCYKDMDDADIYLIKAALKLKKPIFGICRGIQIINVALGGTLYQDLAIDTGTTIKHPDYTLERVGEGHDINIIAGTPMAKLFDGAEKIRVNSCHHQGLKELGDGLKAMAKADDGLVEALYLDSDENWIRAYQEHPEFWLDSPDSEKMFMEFINECSK